MGHTQTENYDMSQPICENPQLALWALEQIIQANKDGNNEAAFFMTVKRCQTCGAWPTCRLDSDGQHVTIVIECSQNTNHPRIIGLWHETVKDIIRTWNHQNSNPFMEDRETRNIKSETERAYTQQQIDSYSMAAPISQDVNLALAVLKQIIQENMQDQCIATLPIRRCPQCNELPTCRLDAKSVAIIMECVQDGHQHSYYCSRSNDSLTEIIIEWNKMQDIVGNLKSVKEHKETEMAVTGEMIEKYDWNEPIKNNRVLAGFALEACIERNFPEKSQFDGAFMYGIPAKMEILRHRNSGEIPKVMKAENGSNIGIGVEGLCYVWACPSETLTTLVNTWNRLQAAPAEKTEEEPPKETSLDVMGRNALSLPKQAKTIEELEPEADRGLPKPEDVRKLKEAHIQQGNDSVNHPSHYTSHPSGIECIQITEHYDFCIGNAIKYLWRAGLKSEEGMTDTAKQIEDLKKAVWYIEREISRLEKGDEK